MKQVCLLDRPCLFLTNPQFCGFISYVTAHSLSQSDCRPTHLLQSSRERAPRLVGGCVAASGSVESFPTHPFVDSAQSPMRCYPGFRVCRGLCARAAPWGAGFSPREAPGRRTLQKGFITSDPRALGSRSAKSTTCSRAPPPSGLRCSMGISAHTAEQGQRHTRRLAAPGLRPSLRHPSLCHCQGHTFSVKATGQPRPTSDGFRPLRTAHTGHPGPLPSPARPLALLRTLETPHGGTLLLRRPRRLGAPRCVRAVSARGAGLYGDVETVGPRAASGGLPR